MTDLELVGKRVAFPFRGVEVTGTVDRLNNTYPDTSYDVTFTKQDNPNFPKLFINGEWRDLFEYRKTHHAATIVHHDSIRRLE